MKSSNQASGITSAPRYSITTIDNPQAYLAEPVAFRKSPNSVTIIPASPQPLELTSEQTSPCEEAIDNVWRVQFRLRLIVREAPNLGCRKCTLASANEKQCRRTRTGPIPTELLENCVEVWSIVAMYRQACIHCSVIEQASTTVHGAYSSMAETVTRIKADVERHSLMPIFLAPKSF